MSWLQDLAGKAETMLNKLDQNAASVLHTPLSEPSKLTPVAEDEPLINVKIEHETPKPKRAAMQLTPKKSASYSSLPELAPTFEDEKRSISSSRRSSVTHDGSVIERVTESAMQTSFTDSPVQLRLVELEEICNSLVTEKQFLVERNEVLEEANSRNIKVISELEATVSKFMRNEMDLTEKLEWARKETNQAVLEMQQYRTRAQQTLQMKEKLIEQLKQGQVSETAGDESTFAALTLEIQQLKTEKRNLGEEVRQLTDKFEANKEYVRGLEAKIHDLGQREGRMRELEEQATVARTRIGQLEEELRSQRGETVMTQDDFLKQKAALTAKVLEKENEVALLKLKIAQRKQVSTPNETEERIHSLTHSLVQKQAALESITAERNALRIQMEKLDTLHRATVLESRGHRPLRMDVNETDDVKARIPIFLQENPFDTRLSRRVKRAYSSLDAAGVRIGTFLRRYPLARIMVIFYIAILHLWVMVVLLTSTPN